MSQAKKCKICGAGANPVFKVPRAKLTGHPFPSESEDNCTYYECSDCGFVYTPDTDELEQSKVYDEKYWIEQDGDWRGRSSQTLRLVMMACSLIKKRPDEARILDFGCGMGAPVKEGLELGLNIWGTDLIVPRFAQERYIAPADLKNKKFDVIVACEVIEHLPDPVAIFRLIASHLNNGGAVAFQTAYWDPNECNRDWWYVGPANGHISFYSRGAFNKLYNLVGGVRRWSWKEYPGLQAWQIGSDLDTDVKIFAANEMRLCAGTEIREEALVDDNVKVGMDVCFGPYAQFEAGKYQLKFAGHISGRYHVRITSDCGKMLIAQEIIQGQRPIEFTCGDISAFECVIKKMTEGSSLRLTELSVSRLDPGKPRKL